MKILVVNSSTNSGGAENQLLEMLSELSAIYEIHLCLLGKPGQLYKDFEKLNLPLYVSNGHILSEILTIAKAIRMFKPDVIFNWLYKADILGAILGKIYGTRKIINNFRNTDRKSTRLNSSHT